MLLICHRICSTTPICHSYAIHCFFSFPRKCATFFIFSHKQPSKIIFFHYVKNSFYYIFDLFKFNQCKHSNLKQYYTSHLCYVKPRQTVLLLLCCEHIIGTSIYGMLLLPICYLFATSKSCSL